MLSVMLIFPKLKRNCSKGKFKATKRNVIICKIWDLEGILV
jgi:hypothetical protein